MINQKKIIPESKIYQDTHSKWWPADEYKNLDRQATVFKESDFLNEYEYFDDYDDELYNE